MNERSIKNLAASVRDKLLALSRQTNESFQLMMTRYSMERFLYRLGISAYRDQFVVKGANLFTLWSGQQHRPTRDLDLLATSIMTADQLVGIFTELGLIAVDDGLFFDTSTIKTEPIRETEEYGGERVTLRVRLGSAVIPLQVDIGFGDVVHPQPVVKEMPVILRMPIPQVLVYSMESVIAEKLHAMTKLGMSNSRMKDFHDIWHLSKHFPFESAVLVKAIQATFHRRKTPLPNDITDAITETFALDEHKQKQWQAFVNRAVPELGQLTLSEVIGELREFLREPIDAASSNVVLTKVWTPATRWK